MTRPVVGPRTTGATDDQIEAATRLHAEDFRYSYDDAPEEVKQQLREHIEDLGGLLVPPDHRIVAVADLKELFHFGESGYGGENYSLIDRIQALIGDES